MVLRTKEEVHSYIDPDPEPFTLELSNQTLFISVIGAGLLIFLLTACKFLCTIYIKKPKKPVCNCDGCRKKRGEPLNPVNQPPFVSTPTPVTTKEAIPLHSVLNKTGKPTAATDLHSDLEPSSAQTGLGRNNRIIFQSAHNWNWGSILSSLRDKFLGTWDREWAFEVRRRSFYSAHKGGRQPYSSSWQWDTSNSGELILGFGVIIGHERHGKRWPNWISKDWTRNRSISEATWLQRQEREWAFEANQGSHFHFDL